MTTMRAVRAHKRGGPEQLVYEDAPRPVPAAGEVLVSVHAASVTNGELAWDATWTDSFDGSGSDRTPIVPSHEVSGVVAELGPGVTGLSVGDGVYGLIPFTRDGAAADFVAVPVDALAVKPSRLTHCETAAVPLAALTAWQALVGRASLTSGQHVLIHGGAGGVGSFAVQIAAALGARVTATASARNREFVSGLGADRVIDYAGERFEDHVDGADVVLDTVGGDTQARSWSVLRRAGTLVSIVQPPNPDDAAARGAQGVFFVVEPDRAGLEAITALIDDGRLTPVVDRVVPLSRTRAAYEALQSEHPRGKIVIQVTEDDADGATA
ncbi:NADP-dependent oxidoreductase [Streptomyces sp. NPDC086777]|uniref:NADP-dependent oxidoreductase n=1 Tax=Streptomyces sp. NPDC086777 TaxID=3154866 RepID=UPI00344B3575